LHSWAAIRWTFANFFGGLLREYVVERLLLPAVSEVAL
jgi:hypothetical protein